MPCSHSAGYDTRREANTVRLFKWFGESNDRASNDTGTISSQMTLQSNGSPTSWKQVPLVVLKGFCMGSADIVPGVSGGTMALILGIYEQLLNAIRSFNLHWLKLVAGFRLADASRQNDLFFLIPLFVGIVAALLFFTRVVPLPSLIISHPEEIYGLFFGLILASIFILMGEVKRFGAREMGFSLAGILIGLAIVNLVPVETPTAGWFIFLCGFVAICAMLLPGISGSFILLILGKYAYIINALGQFDFVVIGLFGAGALIGLAAFSRAIGWLLNRYQQPTLILIKGILIGSLWMIWPFQERVYMTLHGKQKLVEAHPLWPDRFDSTVVASLGFLAGGVILVMVIHLLSRRRDPSHAR